MLLCVYAFCLFVQILGCTFQHHSSFELCTVRLCVTRIVSLEEKEFACTVFLEDGTELRGLRCSLQTAVYISTTVARVVTSALNQIEKFQMCHLQ